LIYNLLELLQIIFLQRFKYFFEEIFMHEVLDIDVPSLKSFPVPDDELLARFEKLFTAVCCDVLDQLYDKSNCVLPPELTPLEPGYKVAGIAFTIKGVHSPVREADEAQIMKRRAEFIASYHKNSFAIWDCSGDDSLAQYGEMMSFSSMSQGCKAAAIMGGVRDVDRVIDMGFKVWSLVRSPRSMRGRHRIIAWQIPITVGDVKVYPGDVVFADMDGIIVIPRDLAWDVLIEAERRKNEELSWRQILATGISPVDALKQGVKF
jgi:regulator of RNase E activity RraA